jgi:hypothetical protein
MQAEQFRAAKPVASGGAGMGERQAPGTASPMQPSGWKGVWHQESKVYWIVTLTGKWFVEAMDGVRVELGPGDVSLGEDQNTKEDAQGRKGHRSGYRR